MQSKNLIIVLISFMLGMILTYNLMRFFESKTEMKEVVKETILRDTIRIEKPKIVEVYREKRDTLKVVKEIIRKDTIYLKDTLYLRETKTYEDKHYKAVVSGYDVRLDSINVYQQTIEKKVTQVRYKKYSLGLQGGYGITPKGFQPYVGIGIAIRL